MTLNTGVHYPLRLDSLPVDWRAGYVGDFAKEIEPGFASGEHNQTGSGVPHLRPMNVDRDGKIDLSVVKFVAADKDHRRLQQGDVLFNNTNSPELVGKTAVVNRSADFAFSNHMTRIRFGEDVLPKFGSLQLHFLWMRGYFRYNCVKHVNQASISSKTLARAVPFIWMPVDEQGRIVAEIEKQFSRLDEAVASLKRVKANLKRYKATVLKAAVEGRLVITEAQLARREGRNYESGEQFLHHLLQVRRSEWKGSRRYKEPVSLSRGGLAELPEGWAWASVDQLLAHITDGDHQPPPQTKSGVPFVVIGDVRSGNINLCDTRFVGHKYYESIDQNRRPKKGDLLYTLVGSYGITVPVTVDMPFCVQRHIAILRPHSASPVAYLLVAMASDVVFKQATACATGTAQMTVPLAGLRAIRIPLPPLAEQHRIATEVDRRLSLVDAFLKAIAVDFERVATLRHSILSASFLCEGNR